MRFERVKRNGAVLVELLQSDLIVPADQRKTGSRMIGRIVDLSSSGMKLNVDGPIPVNTKVNLGLTIKKHKYRLQGRVKWSSNHGQHFIGLRLNESISFDRQRWYRLFTDLGSAGKLN